ncbi:uncharacterized protein [Marmota flaviventris]|uniref:uncharacterized protein n=1 Tax=Marmota flaviventris TaxID=93162 RepID=UPI003A8708C9
MVPRAVSGTPPDPGAVRPSARPPLIAFPTVRPPHRALRAPHIPRTPLRLQHEPPSPSFPLRPQGPFSTVPTTPTGPPNLRPARCPTFLGCPPREGSLQFPRAPPRPQGAPLPTRLWGLPILQELRAPAGSSQSRWPRQGVPRAHSPQGTRRAPEHHVATPRLGALPSPSPPLPLGAPHLHGPHGDTEATPPPPPTASAGAPQGRRPRVLAGPHLHTVPTGSPTLRPPGAPKGPLGSRPHRACVAPGSTPRALSPAGA